MTTISSPTATFQNVKSNTYTANYAYKPAGNPLIDFRLNAYANEARDEVPYIQAHPWRLAA